jgi:tripartite ATP-independent transporter DctM subunit
MGAIAFVFSGSVLIGVPIAFVLGLSSLYYFLFVGRVPMDMIGQKLYSGTDNFVLLAIPFFILAGDLMNRAKITDSLVGFAQLLVGRIPGALAQVTVVCSIFFAGITGAGVADVAALGSVLIPAMKKEGYTAEYAAAITVAGSVIGPIIPPSIIMVVYSMVTGESVGALFAAGFVPGLAIGFALMIMSYYFAIKQNHPRRKEKIPFTTAVVTIRKSLIALMCPVILVGGILSGYFTPTEAAAIACAYAILAGVVLLKTLTWKDIADCFAKSAVAAAVILLIIAMAGLFSQVLALEHFPRTVAGWILGVTQNKYVFLLLVNLLLLFMGMIMETAASVILLAPILLPIAIQLGIHPLHFALVMLVNLNIGLITPPVGVCLFAAAPIAKVTIEKMSKATLPFIFAELAALMLITYVPELILIVPRMMGFIR